MSNNQSSQDNEEEEIELPEGLNFEGGDGWGAKLSKWIKDNFSSVILPVIALLILGGGIYLYSQNQATAPTVNQPDSKVALEQEKQTEEEPTEKDQKQQSKQKSQAEKTEEKEKQDQPEKETMGGPESAETMTMTAEKGEGITHLARGALKQYLTQNEDRPDLTAEQKIYVEDYLQDHQGSHGLEIGEKVSFSKDLIKEAVNASQNLNQQQLNNITQYANQVPSLNY